MKTQPPPELVLGQPSGRTEHRPLYLHVFEYKS